MPVLDCNVVSCIYNKIDCCCRGKIQVEGRQAEDSEETCCGSFVEIGENRDSYTDKIERPDVYLYVDCDASNCIYNKSLKCDADRIGITGGIASATQNTNCGSFQSKY